MLFTGGYRPRPRDLEAIRSEDLFAYLVEPDTYAAASLVHDLLVKIHAADTAKIAMIKALVAEHLDVDRLLEAFQRPGAETEEPAARRSTRDAVRGAVRRVFRSEA